MSGETEDQPSAWTVDSLLSHFTTIVGQMDRRVDERFHAQQNALQERFDGQQSALEIRASRMDEAFHALQRLSDERDKRYGERFEASQTAIQAALCMSADTPILCADLVWRPAADLLIGDELIAFDENGPDRCYRSAVVTANTLTRDALLRVNTDHGHVRCNYAHPFLLRRYQDHAYEWRNAEDLQPGDMIMKPLEVWDVKRTYEAGWLAGILDGEGCLTFDSSKSERGKISIGQAVGPTADRIDEALKATGASLSVQIVTAREGTQGSQQCWAITRCRDVMEVLGSIRPVRLLKESDRVWEGAPLQASDRLMTVTSIEPAGTGLVASLSTSTRTYIGGGFAVHNTAQEKAVNAALLAADRAVAKAETASEKRFESVNEFRQTLTDQATNFATRNEVETKMDSMVSKIVDNAEQVQKDIAGLSSRMDRSDGNKLGLQEQKQGLNSNIAMVGALMAILFGIATIVFTIISRT